MENQIQSYGDIEIRPFKLAADDLEELTRVLNLAYKQLDDLGFRYHATHQDSSVTRKRIEGAYCLAGFDNGKIVSTITYYKPGMKEGCHWYETEGVGVVGQFGVLPSYQSIGLGAHMLSLVETKAEGEDVREIALDTAEGADHLRKFYEKKGYRFIEYADWEVTNYRSVVMSKNLN